MRCRNLNIMPMRDTSAIIREALRKAAVQLNLASGVAAKKDAELADELSGLTAAIRALAERSAGDSRDET